MTWGQRFKVERDRLGLTQPQLAEAIGSDVRTVKRWEADAAKPDEYLEPVAELSPGFATLVEERLAEIEAAQVRLAEIDVELRVLRDEQTLLRRRARRVARRSAPQERPG